MLPTCHSVCTVVLQHRPVPPTANPADNTQFTSLHQAGAIPQRVTSNLIQSNRRPVRFLKAYRAELGQLNEQVPGRWEWSYNTVKSHKTATVLRPYLVSPSTKLSRHLISITKSQVVLGLLDGTLNLDRTGWHCFLSMAATLLKPSSTVASCTSTLN